MKMQKRKGTKAERLTATEQIDPKHQEDLQRLRDFRLLHVDFFTKCLNKIQRAQKR